MGKGTVWDAGEDMSTPIFRKLDAVAKPGAVLGTNTSTLDINEIANATSRPGAVTIFHGIQVASALALAGVVGWSMLQIGRAHV